MNNIQFITHQTERYSYADGVKIVLEGGCRWVQLRMKDASAQEIREMASVIRPMCVNYGAVFIIDDHVELVRELHADGVHLGQNDLPFPAARALAPDLILGLSTHNPEEALAAQEAGASYINIGPIFPTNTKEVPTGAVGTAMIEAIRPLLHIPFTCMGGIKANNIDQVLSAGASIAAVVTAVTAAPDVSAAAAELRKKILQYRA